MCTLTGTVGSNPTLSAINLTFSNLNCAVKIGLVALWSQMKWKKMGRPRIYSAEDRKRKNREKSRRFYKENKVIILEKEDHLKKNINKFKEFIV